jgi:hypothetical protein
MSQRFHENPEPVAAEPNSFRAQTRMTDMQTEADFTLMAENCATAALASLEQDTRLEFVLMSAMWRNEALRMSLGDHAWLLRRCPFEPEQLETV